MEHYIGLKKANCKNCYKCIRHCPVKAIRFSDNQAHISTDECILCGMCFVACPQNAKEIRNDVDQVKALLASEQPVYVSLAPAFVANYDGAGVQSLTDTLMSMGFAGVEETAVGATMVTREYERCIQENPKGVYLTSCCHTINTLIQKYYPEALSYLLPVASPMLAHGKHLKELHPGCHTIFIGPCISKKAEIDQYPGAIDVVLTFEELSQWFANEQVNLRVKQEPPSEGRARLFPTPGGILQTFSRREEEMNYFAIDGIENCKCVLENLKAGNLSACLIEMSACAGSCVGGPAMSKNRLETITDRIVVNQYAGTKQFEVAQLARELLKKEMPFIGLHRQMPGSKAIEEILHKMGKHSEEQELNCGSCGYNTCREKAIAVYLGKADLSMCLPYLKEKAETFSDHIIYNTPNGILVLNEELEVQQINRSACQIMNIQHKGDILNCPVVRILDPVEYLNVMATGVNIHDKHKYLAEYRRYVEETVIYDNKYHIIMIIMRDITKEERERSKREELGRNTIEITDKVIEKQMRVVQEIASLLGETTAETKIALTNLKETLKNE